MKMWVKIDRLRLGGRHNLLSTDECYFARERLIGARYDESEGNQLITNLQISPRETHRIRHKESAIKQFAKELNYFPFETGGYIMPMPSSKTEKHPEYDDRLIRVCHFFCEDINPSIKYTNPILSSRDFQSAKSGGPRDVLTFKNSYKYNPLPEDCHTLYIVDDALTMGTHFRAVSDIISINKPGIRIIGLFWVINVYQLSQ